MFNRFLILSFFLVIIGCASSMKNSKMPRIITDCRDVKIHQNKAYGACGNFIYIKDLKTKIHTEVWEVDGHNNADDISLFENYLFTIGMDDTLNMYEISHPLGLKLIDTKNDIPVKFYNGITFIADKKMVLWK